MMNLDAMNSYRESSTIKINQALNKIHNRKTKIRKSTFFSSGSILKSSRLHQLHTPVFFDFERKSCCWTH